MIIMMTASICNILVKWLKLAAILNPLQKCLSTSQIWVDFLYITQGSFQNVKPKKKLLLQFVVGSPYFSPRLTGLVQSIQPIQPRLSIQPRLTGLVQSIQGWTHHKLQQKVFLLFCHQRGVLSNILKIYPNLCCGKQFFP